MWKKGAGRAEPVRAAKEGATRRDVRDACARGCARARSANESTRRRGAGLTVLPGESGRWPARRCECACLARRGWKPSGGGRPSALDARRSADATRRAIRQRAWGRRSNGMDRPRMWSIRRSADGIAQRNGPEERAGAPKPKAIGECGDGRDARARMRLPRRVWASACAGRPPVSVRRDRALSEPAARSVERATYAAGGVMRGHGQVSRRERGVRTLGETASGERKRPIGGKGRARGARTGKRANGQTLARRTSRAASGARCG